MATLTITATLTKQMEIKDEFSKDKTAELLVQLYKMEPSLLFDGEDCNIEIVIN